MSQTSKWFIACTPYEQGDTKGIRDPNDRSQDHLNNKAVEMVAMHFARYNHEEF